MMLFAISGAGCAYFMRRSGCGLRFGRLFLHLASPFLQPINGTRGRLSPQAHVSATALGPRWRPAYCGLCALRPEMAAAASSSGL
eukprot:5358235-Prymnesium_polylepis.1